MTKKLICAMVLLLLTSCTAADVPQTEQQTKDVRETDKIETALTEEDSNNETRDGILANPEIYDEFSAMVLENTGLEITDENISYTYRYNSDSRYPHIFIVNRRTDGINFILEFGSYTQDDAMHIGERNTATMYYGERAEDDRLITLNYEKPSMFRLRLEDVLAEQFGEDVKMLVIGIIQSDTSLGIPIMTGEDFYFVDTGILRENNREDYKITGYEKVDLNAVTPYEFFIKYNAFGLEPLEFCKYNSVFGEKLNSALTEKFGQEFSFDNYDYMVSEFFPKTFIRLRNETTNTWIHLYNEKIEKSFAPADVTEDTTWDDLRMIVGAPSRRTDYSKAGDLFLPIINYMNVLTDYVHEPYQMGDSLIDSNILYLFALLCSCMDPDAPVYVDCTIEDYVITIAKSELERLAVCLFGDNFDLTEHHSTLNGKNYKYDPDTDSYTFQMGTDYWNGDNITIDYDSVVITEKDDTVTVEVSLGWYPSMGDPADPDSFRDYVYYFEKVESRGIGYLRLVRIEEKTSDKESPAEHLSLYTVSDPEEITASGTEIDLSHADAMFSVGGSIIVVGEMRDGSTTLSRTAVRFDKETLAETGRMEIPVSGCYTGSCTDCFVLIYSDRVEYYDEYFSLTETVQIPADSIYYNTAVNTHTFGTYEPVMLTEERIAFITEDGINILCLRSGEEISVSEYNGWKLDVRQIIKTDSGLCFGIMADLYTDESDRYIRHDDSRYYFCIAPGNGSILDAVCSADLKANDEFLVPETMHRYHIDKSIPVSHDWTAPLFSDVVENGMIELSAGESGGLHVMDAVSEKIVRYSDDSESSIGVRDVIREYSCSYMLAYARGGDFEEKVLLLKYTN